MQHESLLWETTLLAGEKRNDSGELMKKKLLLAYLVLVSASCSQEDLETGEDNRESEGIDGKNWVVPLGSQRYRQFADSPFAQPVSGYFYLEDFEDHLLDTPGVTSSYGVISSSVGDSSLVDSVDGDDQDPYNDSCVSCDAYLNINGPEGLEFTFDDAVLPRLPTRVGLVYTDSGPESDAIFTVFDVNDEIVVITRDWDIADHTNTMSSIEDRFFGIIASQGIRRITLVATNGVIEADHLQYGAPKQ
jgi:hypothetical protein